jgi:hypothetical protein
MSDQMSPIEAVKVPYLSIEDCFVPRNDAKK